MTDPDYNLIDGIENHPTEKCDNSECRCWDPAYQDCIAADCFYCPEEEN